MHVAGGQTGKPPVFEVRPEGQTGKPRLLHTSLLLPFDFLQVDHPDPSANQSQGKVPSSFPKKVRERLQKDKFGMSDSVGEDDIDIAAVYTYRRHCTSSERKAEVTNETMTEHVATPHGYSWKCQ